MTAGETPDGSGSSAAPGSADRLVRENRALDTRLGGEVDEAAKRELVDLARHRWRGLPVFPDQEGMYVVRGTVTPEWGRR